MGIAVSEGAHVICVADHDTGGLGLAINARYTYDIAALRAARHSADAIAIQIAQVIRDSIFAIRMRMSLRLTG